MPLVIKKEVFTSFLILYSYILLGDFMNKLKIIGILILTGFTFFYTDKVSKIIRNNDPIMNRIDNIKDTMTISKIDPVIYDDEYITGINGCVVNREESYKKMKSNGEYNSDLIVMKEDKVDDEYNKYVIGGPKQNRKVSIILINYDEKINSFIKENNIDINYFIDGSNIKKDIGKLLELEGKIYYYGRDKKYLDKYILYDNSLIKSNFNNESNYCLVNEKDNNTLEICSKYKMKTIKANEIKVNVLNYVKENLGNGKIFLIDSNYEDIKYSINYILSKGYKIVYLDELLDKTNDCR